MAAIFKVDFVLGDTVRGFGGARKRQNAFEQRWSYIYLDTRPSSGPILSMLGRFRLEWCPAFTLWPDEQWFVPLIPSCRTASGVVFLLAILS